MLGKRYILAAAIAVVLQATLLAADGAGTRTVVKLFDGKSLEGFDTYLKESGLNNDPKGVFIVSGGVVHVSGEEYGYFVTKKEYESYDLKFEFKWGEATHAPRKDKARDAGVLFHVVGPNMVWPKSIEFQVVEGRTGEIILVGEGSSVTRDGETKTRTEGGGSSRFARFGQGPWKDEAGYRDPEGEVEMPHGEWNQLELIADGDSFKYFVNGKLVNQGSRANPSKGRIIFQSEGAEVFYRNIELRPLR